MRGFKRTSLPLLLILLGVFACVIPGTPQVDQNAAGTAVQETLSAIIKQTEDAGQSIVDYSTDTPEPTLTSSATFTAILPTFTSTLTPTSTLPPTPFPTWTPTYPMLSVSVATNCRVGPGKIYTLLGGLPAGQSVRVYARDPGENYWYIRNPDKPAQFCWVWGEYGTVIGPVGGLPVYTPPPSPTPTITSTPAPDFDASYAALQTCSNKWWFDFRLKNTGTASFRSANITFKDTVTGTLVNAMTDGFTDRTNCSSSSKAVLAPGKTLIASSPQIGYQPGGHKINATITLCTDIGLNGYCVTQKLSFKP